ncbi:MAG: hypothetical protein V1863_05200, partial [Candidatus Omnitrophota bacterium]
SSLRPAQQRQAAESLERWLAYEGAFQVVHSHLIREYKNYLFGKIREVGELYLVVSLKPFDVEGLCDLKVKLNGYNGNADFEYAMMEIAPWNRVMPFEQRRYLGVGHELRVFAIKKLLEISPDLKNETVRDKIRTLGNRDEDADIFEDGVTPWSVAEYLEIQQKKRNAYIQEYGLENNLEDGDDEGVSSPGHQKDENPNVSYHNALAEEFRRVLAGEVTLEQSRLQNKKWYTPRAGKLVFPVKALYCDLGNLWIYELDMVQRGDLASFKAARAKIAKNRQTYQEIIRELIHGTSPKRGEPVVIEPGEFRFNSDDLIKLWEIGLDYDWPNASLLSNLTGNLQRLFFVMIQPVCALRVI